MFWSWSHNQYLKMYENKDAIGIKENYTYPTHTSPKVWDTHTYMLDLEKFTHISPKSLIDHYD